jgi:hypothetical protein
MGEIPEKRIADPVRIIDCDLACDGDCEISVVNKARVTSYDTIHENIF